MVANKQCLLLCCRFYGYLEITTGFGDSDRIWRCDFYIWRLRFYLEIEIELGDRYFATRDTWPLCATIRLFHTRGAAAPNARSPIVRSRVLRTTSL